MWYAWGVSTRLTLSSTTRGRVFMKNSVEHTMSASNTVINCSHTKDVKNPTITLVCHSRSLVRVIDDDLCVILAVTNVRRGLGHMP